MPVPVPAFIQANSVFSSTPIGIISCPFTSNVTAGNLILVAIGYADHSNLYNETVSDTLGNTYQRADAVNAGLGYGISLWWTKSLASGSNTVNVNMSQNGDFYRVGIHEYHNVDIFDTSVHVTGSGTSIDSGPIVTTRQNQLIFGWAVHDSPPVSAGTGFTVRETISGEITEDMVASIAGSYDVTASSGASQTWWVIGASFYLDIEGLILDSSLSMITRGFVEGPNLGSQLNTVNMTAIANGGTIGASDSQQQVPEFAYFQMML